MYAPAGSGLLRPVRYAEKTEAARRQIGGRIRRVPEIGSYMSARNQHRPCVYCGLEKKVTADHVPPKLLLSQPYPNNLLTVPACRNCNASFQLDDEYTRMVLSIDVRGAKHPDVRSNLPAIVRSLQRPNARAFADYLTSRMAETRTLAMNETPMGHALEVDRKRINATGERMVRGLFFIEMGKPLSPTAHVRIAANTGANASDPVIRQFARIYVQCSDHRDREIGRAFSYAAGISADFSVWILLLYDYFVWIATIEHRCPHQQART
jgi:hypothetical protein